MLLYLPKHDDTPSRPPFTPSASSILTLHHSPQIISANRTDSHAPANHGSPQPPQADDEDDDSIHEDNDPNHEDQSIHRGNYSISRSQQLSAYDRVAQLCALRVGDAEWGHLLMGQVTQPLT